ncbi:hypothetical protein ACWDRB_01465 [Nonomuraea sp. NPDC003707]
MRLTRWRMLWILLTKNFLSCFLPEWAKLLIGLAAILGAGVAGTLLSLEDGSIVGVLLVSLGLGACAVAFATDRWRRRFRWRCPALPLDDQPRLRELVADAARLAGFDAVPEVHVSAWAEVRASRTRRGEPILLVGLPLLLAADEAELHTLMVGELLAARRWSWHERWAVHLFVAHHSDWSWLGEETASLRETHWAETRSIVGSERFAAGMRAERLLSGAFGWHTTRYVAPFSGSGGAADVYESFLWKIQRDGLLTRVRPAPALPGMAEVIDWDTAQPIGDGVALMPVPSGVMATVPPKLATRLGKVVSHKLIGRGGFALGMRPFRMADLPVEAWARVGEYQREVVLASRPSCSAGRPPTWTSSSSWSPGAQMSLNGGIRSSPARIPHRASACCSRCSTWRCGARDMCTSTPSPSASWSAPSGTGSAWWSWPPRRSVASRTGSCWED